MKEISLTQGYVALVDNCDYLLLNQWKWRVFHTKYNSYAHRSAKIGNKWREVLMHRVIMMPSYGLIVDHIDGNGLNNVRSNLRVCTYSQNQTNKKPKGKSKYMGVYFRINYHKLEIHAKMTIEGKVYNLGKYPTEEDAALAYDKAAIKHGNTFANLNFLKHE